MSNQREEIMASLQVHHPSQANEKWNSTAHFQLIGLGFLENDGHRWSLSIVMRVSIWRMGLP
jgi:hypothetical protein